MRDLSLLILDLLGNSLEAQASRIELSVFESVERNCFEVIIADNGRGMTATVAAQALNPFFTSRRTRRVGLGLPLANELCIRCGGALHLESAPCIGTTLRLSMQHSHFDRPPMGDIAGTLMLTCLTNPALHLIYRHQTDQGHYLFDSEATIQQLGFDFRTDHTSSQYIKEMVSEHLELIGASR